VQEQPLDLLPRPGEQLVMALMENLDALRQLPDECVDLCYIDPPFNTGKVQAHTRIRTVHDEAAGDRKGFGGRRYRTEVVGQQAFADRYMDFQEFLAPRLRELHRVLGPHGSLFLHLDSREVHYSRVLLDSIFGREHLINEIIWAYDYGGRPRDRWPAKHDNILWYAKDPHRYTFDLEAADRIPYMAPKLVGAEKAARGKTPTDVWWHTIVPTNSKERTGYPTQKPLGILTRIVRVHSRPGDLVLDCFAGSGTTGEAAVRGGRRALLVDNNPEAVGIMKKRLEFARPRCIDHRP
jgi:site-specific DNA-methyltransferase (adenine-specific)